MICLHIKSKSIYNFVMRFFPPIFLVDILSLFIISIPFVCLAPNSIYLYIINLISPCLTCVLCFSRSFTSLSTSFCLMLVSSLSRLSSSSRLLLSSCRACRRCSISLSYSESKEHLLMLKFWCEYSEVSMEHLWLFWG